MLAPTYDFQQLIGMIAANSLTSIHAKLVQEGRVSPHTVPSVDALGSVIDEQSKRLSAEQFFGWLENLLDVPLEQHGMYFAELSNLRDSTGRTPAKVLVDQMREQMPTADASGMTAVFGGVARMNWLSWVLLLLALIGAVCVLRLAVRVVGKMTE